MERKKPWRVRVRRAEEVWVDVEATSAEEAEAQAAVMPRVLSVFGKSATPADKVYSPGAPEGVQESELFPR